jgi:DNA-binding NtrC family response regulator
LIIEDDAQLRANLLFQLRNRGYEASGFAAAEEAVEPCKSAEPPDLLLLDVRLRMMSGIELVAQLAADKALPTTVMISGEASVSEAVEALRLGVYDFIEKPFSSERLFRSLENALRHRRMQHELVSLRDTLAGDRELLGESEPVRELRDRIERAGSTDGRVLIQGESGVGKELVADLLHRMSARRDGPFIKINCAALPPHLIEGELFGHTRGAFTGARTDKAGLFEAAHAGTLFLDEIGDMEPALQARLLRVLEDGKVRRIGETHDRQVDVRILAATHRLLDDAIAGGTFRQDLYFRLAHLPIEIPPLRERGADIHLLYHHFLTLFARRHRRPEPQTEPACLDQLLHYSWPGNVRELRNLCERLVVFGSDPITVDNLPSSLATPGAAPETGLLHLAATTGPLTLRDLRTQCEKEYIEAVLQRTNWNFTAAAKILGLQRSYLHEKAKALGLHRKAAQPS